MQGIGETSTQESSYTDMQEQEYESKLLVSPTAPHPGSISISEALSASSV